jgi:hypothetical protein
MAWQLLPTGDGRTLPAVIPEFEDEHASVSGDLEERADVGRKTEGAESDVDTSIRRRPCDDAEVTEVQAV